MTHFCIPGARSRSYIEKKNSLIVTKGFSNYLIHLEVLQNSERNSEYIVILLYLMLLAFLLFLIVHALVNILRCAHFQFWEILRIYSHEVHNISVNRIHLNNVFILFGILKVCIKGVYWNMFDSTQFIGVQTSKL